jgi:hypothetical protein
MSSLNWVEAFFSRHGSNPAVPELYYELWVVGQDRTAWYNLPVAYIYRKGKRLYELEITDDETHSRQFTTLKAAKAMGIALVRMDDAV